MWLYAGYYKGLLGTTTDSKVTMCSPIRVSVVGTAGRSEDGKKMTSALFKRMIDKTVDVITDVFKLDMGRVRLVSGGAAWSGECNSRLMQPLAVHDNELCSVFS